MPGSSRKTQEIVRSPFFFSKLERPPGGDEGCALLPLTLSSLDPFAQPVAKAGLLPATDVGYGWSAKSTQGTLHHQHHLQVSIVATTGWSRWLAWELLVRCLPSPPRILPEVPSLPAGQLSSSSWTCSSHTPSPCWRVAWAFEQLPNHKISINVFSGRGWGMCFESTPRFP